jgi:hypothetical protein
MRKNTFGRHELESDWTRTSKIRPVAGEFSGSDRRSYGGQGLICCPVAREIAYRMHLRSSTDCNPATEAPGNCKEDVDVILVLRGQIGRQWPLSFWMTCQLQ